MFLTVLISVKIPQEDIVLSLTGLMPTTISPIAQSRKVILKIICSFIIREILGGPAELLSVSMSEHGVQLEEQKFLGRFISLS